VSPTGAYRTLHVPADVRLLDYEVELGFVVLDDIDLTAIPSPSELDGMVAYFVANDVSDREPIIKRSGASGPGTGFVEGKGKPGFMPLGPWMVHGNDLPLLSDNCSRSLRIKLSVREPGRVTQRQDAQTDAMIAGPREILETLAEEVDPTEPGGNRTEMSVTVDGQERFYPLALVKDGKPVLPKGSIVLTGTPGGTALEAPSRFSLVMRAIVRFQSPRSRFLEDQLETRDAEGYLGDGDVVIADIEELGTQWWQVRWSNASQPDPCGGAVAAVP
jgi:2-keto-4-pentenoate hydratase/2-oxohepta-3-ene-1,7-dioic acid hydratase in catechol pathway